MQKTNDGYVIRAIIALSAFFCLFATITFTLHFFWAAASLIFLYFLVKYNSDDKEDPVKDFFSYLRPSRDGMLELCNYLISKGNGKIQYYRTDRANRDDKKSTE